LGKIVFTNVFVAIMLANFENARQVADIDKMKAEKVNKNMKNS